MRGTSQASLDGGAGPASSRCSRPRGEQAYTIGEQMFAVVDALDASGALRRSLADPSRPAADKVGARARPAVERRSTRRRSTPVADLVADRWSHEADLADAVEHPRRSTPCWPRPRHAEPSRRSRTSCSRSPVVWSGSARSAQALSDSSDRPGPPGQAGRRPVRRQGRPGDARDLPSGDRETSWRAVRPGPRPGRRDRREAPVRARSPR